MFDDRRDFSDIPNPETRLDELEYRLRRAEPDGAVRTLVRLLDDNYPPIRHRAASELGALLANGALSEPVETALIRFCRSAIQHDHQAMIHALSEMSVSEDLPPSSDTRQASCRILAGAGTRTSDTLTEALADEHPDVRYRAMVSLHDTQAEVLTDSEIADYLHDNDLEVAAVSAQWLAERGATQYTDAILARRREIDSNEAMTLALAAAELIGDHAASASAAEKRELVDVLIAGLEDERTAPAAAKALVSMDARQAVEPLTDLLSRWFIHPIIRVQSAAALAELEESRGVEFLEQSLEHWRKDVRGAAIRAVGRIGIERFRADLEAMAQSEDYHADTAVLALADWGDDPAQHLLQNIARSHADPSVKQLAERALRQLEATGRVETDQLQF